MPPDAPSPDAADLPAIPRAVQATPVSALGLGGRHLGGEAQLGFSRSLVLSTAIHAAALGCSLLVAFGTESGLQGRAAPAHLVFAEAPPDSTWRLVDPEPERSELDTPEEPPAELMPVTEQLPSDPFQPDPALDEVPPEQVSWTRVGPEPLDDLRERLAERRRQEALAAAATAVPPPAAASASAPASPRGEDRPPRLVDAPRPSYPRISLRLEEHGVVLVRIHVGADGHVSGVDLLESSGFERLDTAALEAVRRWRFDPQLRDGHAVAGTFDHRVVFVLEQPAG